MSEIFNAAMPSSRRTVGTPMWWSVVVLLALFAIAAALIVASINPALDGHVMAVLVGLLILVIAVVVTIAMRVLNRLRSTTSNDDWIYR
jgi:uncharacterized membrane protein YfcA